MQTDAKTEEHCLTVLSIFTKHNYFNLSRLKIKKNNLPQFLKKVVVSKQII